MTATADAALIDGTVFAGSTGLATAVIRAEKTRRVAFRVGGTRDGLPHAANIGSGTADKVEGAVAVDAVVHHRALGVGTAGGTAFARVDALVARTDKVFGALVVVATSTLAPVRVANFVILAFLVGTAEENTVATEAFLPDGAVLVEGALGLTAAIDANVILRAIYWREAHSHESIAGKLGVAGKGSWTGAYRLVGHHGTLCVGSTRSRRVAHVLAAVEDACPLVGALVVISTTNLAPLVVAYFTRQALLVGGAGHETASLKALLVGGAVFVCEARWSTLARIADHTCGTIGFSLTDGRHSDATSSQVFRISSKAFWTSTGSLPIGDTAECIRSAGIFSFAGILAH